MRVEGVDIAAGAYRVAIERPSGTLRGLVPEHLLGGGRAGPSHQTAHEALARQHGALTAAFDDLAAGRTPRPTYDTLTLAGER